MSKEKEYTLQEIADSIRKAFGKDSVMNLNSIEKTNEQIPSISTGCKQLNEILEIGGFPQGSIIELFGQESSGKTTLCLSTIKEAQKAGKVCSFVDAEHSFDVKYAKTIGVNLSKLLFTQPEYGEQALDIVEKMVDLGVGVIVVDSLAALVPKAVLDGSMEDKTIGAQARMMAQFLQKICHRVRKNNCILIFINQVRDKIGVMFGDKTTTPGGRSLKFYASLRISVTRIKTLKEHDIKISNLTKVEIKKSKVSTPYRSTEFSIKFGVGIIEE